LTVLGLCRELWTVCLEEEFRACAQYAEYKARARTASFLIWRDYEDSLKVGERAGFCVMLNLAALLHMVMKKTDSAPI
jgi:hypothetical protein